MTLLQSAWNATLVVMAIVPPAASVIGTFYYIGTEKPVKASLCAIFSIWWMVMLGGLQ